MSPVGSTFGLYLSHSFVNHIRFVIFEVFGGLWQHDIPVSNGSMPSAGLLLSGTYTNTVVTNVLLVYTQHNRDLLTDGKHEHAECKCCHVSRPGAALARIAPIVCYKQSSEWIVVTRLMGMPPQVE